MSGSILLSVLAAIAASIIILKLADWSDSMVNNFLGMKCISIPTLSVAAYFLFGVLGNKLIDKIPYLNKIDANPEKRESFLKSESP